MTYGQSSNTTAFSPFVSDIVLDALERCSIYAPETKHLTSARRSLNLLLTSKWSNSGLNLWRISELVTPLTQGITTYNLTSDIVSVMDTYRRQYQMNAAVSAAVNFSTLINTPTVTVNLANAGVAVGGYFAVTVPVSIGGIVLLGFYQVVSTPSANQFTITAAANATSSVTNGGAVPVFTSTVSSTAVNVLLNNHGLLAGQPFVVQVSTSLGGTTVFGSYSVATVVDANNFTITLASAANSNDTESENGGQGYFASQNTTTSPTDILMTPWSRNDYAAMADKFAPGPPTVYWVDRTITPSVTVWPVTDATGPYEMRSYIMRQIQDANPVGGQTLNLVQRAYYACTLDLARDLAMKFSPKLYPVLKQEALDAWTDMTSEDVEHVSSFLIPSFPRV